MPIFQTYNVTPILPPALEPLAPRTYNRLAQAWQRSLERSPAGLAFSTAFVAVFERT